ncbi:facilitated trehalose transporter Tret1-like [Manduca sexta]|uniref:facilitated trehalose transporter Tret1-like n=1 Tax=Manduca sexta TaxID=7130 RepID=UPI00188FF9C3|nr:facilitated trehalose transporter Tret1-like [Manduca sexta]
MTSCNYKEVNTEEIAFNEKKPSWKPFFRQVLVCTGVWTSYFMFGLCSGAPTVFIPQIRKEANSTEIITDEMASWLTSIFSLSGFPWVIVFSVFTRCMGRKLPFIIAAIDTFLAFVVLFFSTNITQILISEIMHGFFGASQIVVSILVLTEYTSPRYRGLFLTLKSATYFWGIWASNAIGTFLHWKKIPLFGIMCSVYTLLTVTVWPESPYWLASQGKYEECAISHRWLKGCDDGSEKELASLIDTQKEYQRNNIKRSMTLKENIKDLYVTVTSQVFYKPILIATMTGTLSIASGKLVFTVYAIDIIKKITDSEKAAYIGMLILDGVTVLSMYFGCALSKILKRRTLLLTAGSIGVLFLFLLSAYLYLIKLSFVNENKYVSIFLLSAFSLAVSCGPLILSTSVYGELIPVRSRNLAICVIAVVGKIIIGTVLKISPSIFKTFGLHGAFLTFAIATLTLLLLLYKYLPETKDKTLQEIAESMKVTPKTRKETITLISEKKV